MDLKNFNYFRPNHPHLAHEDPMELDDPYHQYHYTTLDTFAGCGLENHKRYRGKNREAFLIQK